MTILGNIDIIMGKVAPIFTIVLGITMGLLVIVWLEIKGKYPREYNNVLAPNMRSLEKK